MKSIGIYLNFNGKTEEAFKFYLSVFGGQFTDLARFKDTPEGSTLSPADQQRILHVSLPIGKQIVLQGSDILESRGQTLTVGNHFSISIETESKAETERLFNALSAGGKTNMPLQDVFWGEYFGMLTDLYGIQWMINYNHQQQK